MSCLPHSSKQVGGEGTLDAEDDLVPHGRTSSLGPVTAYKRVKGIFLPGLSLVGSIFF